MLMHRMPIKNTKSFHFEVVDIFPTLNKMYPSTRLSKPHRTLTVGEDMPLPGGCAKGVGKTAPEIPCIK